MTWLEMSMELHSVAAATALVNSESESKQPSTRDSPRSVTELCREKGIVPTSGVAAKYAQQPRFVIYAVRAIQSHARGEREMAFRHWKHKVASRHSRIIHFVSENLPARSSAAEHL